MEFKRSLFSNALVVLLLTGCTDENKFNNSPSDNTIDSGYIVRLDENPFLFT